MSPIFCDLNDSAMHTIQDADIVESLNQILKFCVGLGVLRFGRMTVWRSKKRRKNSPQQIAVAGKEWSATTPALAEDARRG